MNLMPQNPPQNPGDLFLNALTSNYADDVSNFWKPPEPNGRCEDIQDNNIFILIKPRQRQNVEIAYQTSKWVFAPQTEKKILNFRSNRKTVYLLFTVNHTSSFQGVAKFIKIYTEMTGKPTAVIEWIFKADISFQILRHLRNPYNNNRPLYEGVDGQIIQEQIGEELLELYSCTSNTYCRTTSR